MYRTVTYNCLQNKILEKLCIIKVKQFCSRTNGVLPKYIIYFFILNTKHAFLNNKLNMLKLPCIFLV